MNLDNLRSFIALELTSEIKTYLTQVQNELKKSAADIKWVDPAAMHLTLKFLGKIKLELLGTIKRAIDLVANKHSCFELSLSHLGEFPKLEQPRVIWMGLAQGQDMTVRLAQELQKHLTGFGLLPEKRAFHAHITLGRVRSRRNQHQLQQTILSTNYLHNAMQVKAIVLFQSILNAHGPIYQPLHQAPLKPSP